MANVPPFIAFQPPNSLISRISPSCSCMPLSSLVTLPFSSNLRASPRVFMLRKYERSLFWKSSGMFLMILYMYSTVAFSSGVSNVKLAFLSSEPFSPSLGTCTPGWSVFTISPLRLASSTGEFSPVGWLLPDSVPVAPFDGLLASPSGNSLLLRVRGFVLSGATSGFSATGAL